MNLVRLSVPEQISEVLLPRIGCGELAPGQRIVEGRLTEEFGVSAIPVREAIRELVAMGVLDSAAHKGAWVREVSVTETIEAFQVRAALESLAAMTAANALRGNYIPHKGLLYRANTKQQPSYFSKLFASISGRPSRKNKAGLSP